MLRPPLHTPQIEEGYCVPACARMGWVERDNTCALFSRKEVEE